MNRWYPPPIVAILSLACFAKAYLYYRVGDFVRNLLETMPNSSAGAPAFPWRNIALITVMLFAGVGLWFERDWARWIVRIWTTFDLAGHAVYLFGLFGIGAAPFRFGPWLSTIGMLYLAWTVRFRRESGRNRVAWSDNDSQTAGERLRRAFTAGSTLRESRTVISAAGETEEFEEYVTLELKHIGELRTASDQMVGLDPVFGFGNARAFVGRIARGSYPAFITPAQHRATGKLYAAFAMIRFSEEPPTQWVPACIPSPTDSDGFELASLAVDSASGCFIDVVTYAACRIQEGALWPSMERFNEYIGDKLGAIIDLGDDGRRIPMQLFLFRTGLGDGLFPVYWGLNSNDEICVLIADFNIGGNTSPRRVYQIRRKDEAQ